MGDELHRTIAPFGLSSTAARVAQPGFEGRTKIVSVVKDVEHEGVQQLRLVAGHERAGTRGDEVNITMKLNGRDAVGRHGIGDGARSCMPASFTRHLSKITGGNVKRSPLHAALRLDRRRSGLELQRRDL
jgi:hypothetical protein